VCKPSVELNADLKPLYSKESVGYVDDLTSYQSTEENQMSQKTVTGKNRAAKRRGWRCHD
jgi:hypothetical protein